MLKHIKSLFRDNFFIIAIGITLCIAYLSLIKTPKLVLVYSASDKIHHIIAYFTLTICWLFSFFKKPSLKYSIVVFCLLFGIIIEVMQQSLTSYRTGDYKDVLANIIGIVLGLIVFNLVLKKNKVKSD
ncbi:MAG: Uncharacterised protein [Polaribacter sejongensis]|nr:MAG: Uncharacterised protein [Polaribacter sejongensis]